MHLCNVGVVLHAASMKMLLDSDQSRLWKACGNKPNPDRLASWVNGTGCLYSGVAVPSFDVSGQVFSM